MCADHHPIEHCPPLSVETRLAILEDHLARLWDEVWWLQLPWWRRCWYQLQGFRSPIQRFYGPD